jgi:OmpA-OmpF porin, OOP family
MKTLFLGIYIFICVQIGAKAQIVQWANKVIEVSSELTPVQYSAEQILGKPNVHPAGGQNPNAWTPDKPKRKESIKVGFEKPIQIQQIAIAETYNPSAVWKIYTYDENGREYLIHTFNPVVVPLKSRMLTVFVEKTPYKVASVKIEFDGGALTDYFSIDAIAITDSNYPIVTNIDIPDLLSKGLITERLDENVNSEFTELNPILTPDGKTLYFSRKNHPGNVGGVNDKEDIWYSELGADGKWTLAKNMGPQFNNESPNFVNAVSAATPDGKSVIMFLGNKYLENGKMLAGISMSNNINGSWTKPTALEIENDYNYNEKSNYFMANTRRSLLMSIERENSRGGRDLYVSIAKNDSLWGEPINLGAVVNTSGEETSPFLATDDKTLYFSSNGFSGYGGSDIYVSTRLDDTWTNWSEPQNMGPDINSKLDDLFFNIPASSEYAYYSHSMTEENMDIFRVKLPVFKSPEPVILVKGTLIDSKTGKPIGAKIIYERLTDGKEVGIVYSNPETGEYEILLPAGHLYGVRAEAEGHISSSQNLDIRNIGKDTTVQHKDFTLDPIVVARIEPNAIITLNNIFFAFNKATLKSESFPELDRIVDLMNKDKTMTVEISGHTDSTGPDDYNMWLSEWRATAVAKYVTQKSIEKGRVSITFFGETKPAVSNDTKAGRDKNRRVEFKIIKM